MTAIEEVQSSGNSPELHDSNLSFKRPEQEKRIQINPISGFITMGTNLEVANQMSNIEPNFWILLDLLP